jgi:ribosome-associated protein
MQVGGYDLPASELEWAFGPTGGPGGQHANRSNTRAQLRFDLAASAAFPPEVKERIVSRLGRRVSEGVITLTCNETRSQLKNRRACEERLAEMLEKAARPAKKRRPTGPSPASKEKRLEEKRRRSQTKRGRVSPADSDEP